MAARRAPGDPGATRATTRRGRPPPPADVWMHRMTAPALTFLAPPSTGAEADDAPAGFAPPSPPGRRRAPQATHDRTPAASLRMTRGAREAATGMKVSDADIRRCLDAPDHISPDPKTPSRTWFRSGNLVVVAGADGMVLRVSRRSR
jgi:hypothetical protein